MSFLSKLKKGAVGSVSHALPRQPGGGVVSLVVDKGERMALSAGVGALAGYYGNRFQYRGVSGALLLGAGAAVLGAVTNAMASGNSIVALHLNRLGDAGLMAHAHGWGVAWGAQKSGRGVAQIQPKQAQKAVAGGDILGMIPQAMGGTYLSADEVNRYAAAK
jgi:hypothetical protein